MIPIHRNQLETNRIDAGRRSISCAVLLGILGCLVSTAQAQQTAMEQLETLGRSLKSEPGWTADYHQEYLSVGLTIPEKTDGVVWVAWPDRAQFRFGRPEIRRLGLEGRTVRLVDVDPPSCDDHVLSDDEWARIPLAPVLDPSAALDRFTVIDLDGEGFALVPREPGGVARLEVVLDPDGLPARVTIMDPQGAVNNLEFLGWRPAPEEPDGGWLPPPPDGVVCVQDGG